MQNKISFEVSSGCWLLNEDLDGLVGLFPPNVSRWLEGRDKLPQYAENRSWSLFPLLRRIWVRFSSCPWSSFFLLHRLPRYAISTHQLFRLRTWKVKTTTWTVLNLKRLGPAGGTTRLWRNCEILWGGITIVWQFRPLVQLLGEVVKESSIRRQSWQKEEATLWQALLSHRFEDETKLVHKSGPPHKPWSTSYQVKKSKAEQKRLSSCTTYTMQGM